MVIRLAIGSFGTYTKKMPITILQPQIEKFMHVSLERMFVEIIRAGLGAKAEEI